MIEIDLEDDVFKGNKKSNGDNDEYFNGMQHFFKQFSLGATPTMENDYKNVHMDTISSMTLDTYRRLTDDPIYNKIENAVDISFKVMTAGDSSVGKSSIMSRLSGYNFSQSTTPTVGMEFQSIHLDDKKLGRIKIDFWDTAGQERFNAMSKNFYRNADGILLVYDITNRDSFDNIKSKWLSQIESNVSYLDAYEYIIISNKIDLEYDRKVNMNDEKKLSESLKCDIFKCSAKSDDKGRMEIAVFKLIAKMVSNDVILRRAIRNARERNKSVSLLHGINNLDKKSNMGTGCCSS